jgi:hypothetical protein
MVRADRPHARMHALGNAQKRVSKNTRRKFSLDESMHCKCARSARRFFDVPEMACMARATCAKKRAWKTAGSAHAARRAAPALIYLRAQKQAPPGARAQAFSGAPTGPKIGLIHAPRRAQKAWRRRAESGAKNCARTRAAARESTPHAREKSWQSRRPYVRWARSTRKKVNDSSRACCALTRFSCTLRD